MTNEQAITAIQAEIAAQQSIADGATTNIAALNAALTVLQNGYTSDATANAAAIKAGIDAGIAALNATGNA